MLLAIVLGYFLRSRPDGERDLAARVGGPREGHADVVFPPCAGCGIPTSPVFRIDFTAPPFAALALWPDVLVALICHNRCDVREGARFWDHRDALRPTELDPSAIVSEGARDDVEYEEIPVQIEARLARDPDVIDTTSRVGGEPAWLQREYRTDAHGGLVVLDPEPPRCPRCTQPTTFLLQWSEAGMDPIPRRVRRRGSAWVPDPNHILGNPFIRFWFGCRTCKVVGSLAQLD